MLNTQVGATAYHRQSPLGRRRLCDVEKSVWISVGDEQQRTSRP